MLGRFLEISLHTPDIQASLQFYEALGFVQAVVGETWSHPYAVVTDGRLYLGLHARPCPPLTLTFVQANLAEHVAKMRARGIEFDTEQFDSESFHQAALADPHGVRIAMLEARTYSPPNIEVGFQSTCGYFTELGIPVRDFALGHDYWESMGFVAMEPDNEPFARMSLTSDRLNLGLYRARAFRQPVLAFEDADMPERLARLRERKFTLLDEMPDSLEAAGNAVLVAPEGTRLLLLTAREEY
jgi:catechol 2,3-dioxygenase-like lactoylglutathione lyase family enzyme